MDYQGRKIIIIVLAAIFLSLIPVYAREQMEAGFSVEPAILDLEVPRGAKIEKIIRIKNTGNALAPAVINLRDLSFNYLSAKDNGCASLADWIQIKNFYFILNPGETREVPFSITVPETAEYRSYWSFLTIEPQVANGGEGSVRTVAMVGIPLLLAVMPEDGRPLASGGLAIENMGPLPAARLRYLEKFVNRFLDIGTALAGETSADAGGGFLIIEKNPYDFNLKIKNTSNYHYYPQGAIRLYSGKNKLMASADIESRAILPGQEKDYSIRMNLEDSKIILGKYRADIDLFAYRGFDSAERERIQKSVEFWVFPWKKILFFALTALPFFLTAILFLFYKNRFISATKILFGGKSLSTAGYRVGRGTDEIKNLYVLKNNQRPAIPKRILGDSDCAGRKRGRRLAQRMKGGEKI